MKNFNGNLEITNANEIYYLDLVTVNGNLTFEQGIISQFNHLTEILGDLIINENARVSLQELERLEGGLTMKQNSELLAKTLKIINGHIALDKDSETELPQLIKFEYDIILKTNSKLRIKNLEYFNTGKIDIINTKLDLSKLIFFKGSLNIFNSNVDISTLEILDGQLHIDGDVSKINAPMLQEIRKSLTINVYKEELDIWLSKLKTIGRRLTIGNGYARLMAPELIEVFGQITLHDSNNLEAPKMLKR